jgi:hypothetical protein
MSATLMSLPSNLKERGLLQSIAHLILRTKHPKKVTDWILSTYKSKKYKSLKIGISNDPNSRKNAYSHGDVMYPILSGNKSRCGKFEDTMISTLSSTLGHDKVSNQIGGGGGKGNWKDGYVYVVFSKRAKVEFKTSGTKGKTTSTKAKTSGKKGKTASTKAKTSGTKGKTASTKAKTSGKKGSRKSPIDSANDHKMGKVKKGEDGKMWVVKKAGNTQKWYRNE